MNRFSFQIKFKKVIFEIFGKALNSASLAITIIIEGDGQNVCCQVCSVLDSLEREYKRDEDWCGGGATSGANISQLINKHQEQKEAFLKACTLARRTAETFLKYTSRSLQYYNYSGSEAGAETRVKGNT